MSVIYPETPGEPWPSGRRLKITLPEFLLARIANDEATAPDHPLGCSWTDPCYATDDAPDETLCDCRRKRVLSECEAKRRIVEDLAHLVDESGGWGALCERQLAHLATVYVDHPDYRQEWRP